MERILCTKCDAEMIAVKDIPLKFGIMPLPNAAGLRCPVCGVELLLKELILGDLAEAEKLLQGK